MTFWHTTIRARNFLSATACAAILAFSQPGLAETAKPLGDLEVAHAAYTADVIDINYAKIALAKTHDPEIRKFAELMIQDHTAVNEGATALLKKLGATPQDNDFSKALNRGAEAKVAELNKLDGKAFDKAYAANELGYHKTVNQTVAGWIPGIQTPELKSFLENALVTFKVHEGHASQMVAALDKAK